MARREFSQVGKVVVGVVTVVALASGCGSPTGPTTTETIKFGSAELEILNSIGRELAPHVRATPEGGWYVDPEASLSPFAAAVISGGSFDDQAFAGGAFVKAPMGQANGRKVPKWLLKLRVTFLTSFVMKRYYERRGYTCYWFLPWWFCAAPAGG